jgi:hypothetical protein
MLIRYGYELTFNSPQPTMMVCLLDAHRERSQELCYEIPPTTIPAIPTRTYLDTFGNTVEGSSGLRATSRSRPTPSSRTAACPIR